MILFEQLPLTTILNFGFQTTGTRILRTINYVEIVRTKEYFGRQSKVYEDSKHAALLYNIYIENTINDGASFFVLLMFVAFAFCLIRLVHGVIGIGLDLDCIDYSSTVQCSGRRNDGERLLGNPNEDGR